MWSNAKLGPHGAFKSSWEALWMHHICAIYDIIIIIIIIIIIMLPQRWWCLSSHNLAKWVVFSGKLYLSSLLTVHIMCTNYIGQSALRYAFFMINVFTIYWLLMSRWVSPIQGKKQTEAISAIKTKEMGLQDSGLGWLWWCPVQLGNLHRESCTTPWASRCGSKWQRCPPPGPAYTQA